jgi:two-component system, cell cycle response regulator CtrA
MRVLLVENDHSIANNLKPLAAAQSFRFETTDTGENALELLRHYEFDMIVLTLSPPDMDGTRLISRIRNSGVATPILALLTRRVRSGAPAFAAGADDVVDERVEATELLARMHAILRRSRGHSQSKLQVGDLTLDLESREVTVNEKPVSLTGREFDLLRLLMVRKNSILTKELILDQIYGGLDEPEAKIIDVFICKIRKKLAKLGLTNVVNTVWGRGYTIQDTSGPRRGTPHLPELAADPRHLVAA